MARKPIYSDDLKRAIEDIARTPDGLTLYLYLQKTLMGVHVGPTTEWALQTHHGKRMFAAELVGLMAKGIEESDRSNRAIVFSSRRSDDDAGRAKRPGPGERRIGANTRVSGWDLPDDTGAE